MATLQISPVAYQPHFVIVHPDKLGQCIILRIPEFIKSADGLLQGHPANIVWEQGESKSQLQYHWGETDAVKQQWGLDLSGQVTAGEDELTFEVTMHNLSDMPNNSGANLFCMQAGGHLDFQDYDGHRTFVRMPDRWVSVNEMQNGKFEDHRMCGYQQKRDGIAHSLIAKVSTGGDWVLGIALNQEGGVSCNHQPWPSCIHANPVWATLAPGESETARGKVYFFRGESGNQSGGLEELYHRYHKDF
jgi:hypothetical protein